MNWKSGSSEVEKTFKETNYSYFKKGRKVDMESPVPLSTTQTHINKRNFLFIVGWKKLKK